VGSVLPDSVVAGVVAGSVLPGSVVARLRRLTLYAPCVLSEFPWYSKIGVSAMEIAQMRYASLSC
jgi:hypothetical protein